MREVTPMIRDMSTPEARAIWEAVDRATLRQLPDWMKRHVAIVAAEWRARLIQRLAEQREPRQE